MKGRILVVDDERAMQLALRGLLSKEGYTVETAGSGKQVTATSGTVSHTSDLTLIVQ